MKRKDYNELHEFTRNLLNGYKTGSEYSEYELSYEESPKLISHRGVSINTNKFSTIMPRDFIRRKTLNRSWSIEEDLEDFLEENSYKLNIGKNRLVTPEKRNK